MLAITCAAAYAQDFEAHRYESDHFSVFIPKNWIELPRQELDRLSEALRKLAPSADAQLYKYGFAAGVDPGEPRVLIQVKNERWSESAFADMGKLPKAARLIQHGVTAANPSLAELQPEIGEMRWDADRQIVWMRTQASNEVEVLSGVHLTDIGSVQVHGSATAESYSKHADTLARIISSVEIDPGFRYKPRNAVVLFVESYPWVPIAAVVLAVALTVQRLRLRKLQR